MESILPALIAVGAGAGFLIGVPLVIGLAARIERNLGSDPVAEGPVA